MNNEEKILEILGNIQADVSGLKTDVSGLKTDMTGMKADVSGLKTDVAEMKTDMTDLKERVIKIEVSQENIVIPQLHTLAEGQANLLATLAPKNRVEALEDDMAFMKSVIKAMSQEIAELKKAQ
jgi:predicted  nucleic acid-binding Zn-ribbon protein